MTTRSTLTRSALAAVAASVALVAAACAAPPAPPAAGRLHDAGARVAAAAAANPGRIDSAGPLTRVETSPALNCAIQHAGDADPAFYRDTACVTAYAVHGANNPDLWFPVLPRSTPGVDEIWPYDPGAGEPTVLGTQSQSGDGSPADPFRVTTTNYNVGALITQTDTYVIGQESVLTDTTFTNVTNALGGALDYVVYRAADCNLQDSDFGYGAFDPATGSVACRGVADPFSPSPVPGPRLEQWTPITAGSHHFEGSPFDLWTTIVGGKQFDDSCACGDYADNAAGLSWTFHLEVGESVTISSLLTISPTGTEPLVTAVRADQPSAAAGTTDGYTIGLHNPNANAVQVRSISDELADGFTYRAGTSSGVTTDDPSVDEGLLTWSGPFVIPAGGDLSLHFDVDVARTAGRYTNDASANAGGVAVAPALAVAPIDVTGVPDESPTVEALSTATAAEGEPIAVTGSVIDDGVSPVAHTWSATAGAGVDPGATCAPADPTALSTDFACTDDGAWTFTLTATDGQNPPVSASAATSVSNAAPALTAPSGVSGSANVPVTVAAPVSDPGTNDTVTCSFTWGDGSSSTAPANSGESRATHTYGSTGTRSVVVTAVDDDGGESHVTVDVTITAATNQPPQVSAGTPITVAEGSNFTTNASVVDPDGPTLATSWQVIPGAALDAGATCSTSSAGPPDLSGSCNDDGEVTLRLTASDSVNPSVSSDVGMTVTNAPPALTGAAATPAAPVAGRAVSVTAALADPGANDTEHCTVDWGDGDSGAALFTPAGAATATGTCSASHVYATAGTYQVAITGTDDDGGSGSATLAVRVLPPLSVDAGPDATGGEGASIALSGSVVRDAFPDATTRWTFAPTADVDPGATCVAADPSAATTQVTCTDDGTWIATLSVDDGTGATLTDAAELRVTNRTPVIASIDLPARVTVNTGTTLAASLGDPGLNDALTCRVDWGDGTTATGVVVARTCTADHTFTSTGSRIVTVTAADDDGATAVRTATVTVDPTTAPRLSIRFHGGLTYDNAGPLTSGGYSIDRDARGLRSVTGTASVPGASGGELTVTVDLRRVLDTTLWYGTVTWRDGAFAGTDVILQPYAVRRATGGVDVKLYGRVCRPRQQVFCLSGPEYTADLTIRN